MFSKIQRDQTLDNLNITNSLIAPLASCFNKFNKATHIVVGYGTSTGPSIRFLSDNPNNNVIVFEAGPNLTDDPNVLQPSFLGTLPLTNNPKYSKLTGTPVTPGLNGPAFVYSDGRMSGGSSAHNGLEAVRGAPEDYDKWAVASGNSQWTYNNLLPIMKGMENYTPNTSPIDPAQRGTAGIMNITQDPNTPYPVLAADPGAIAIATGFNAPIKPDFNTVAGKISTSLDQYWITPPPNSHRTASFTYLDSTIVTPDGFGVNGRKLRIYNNATVTRILFDGTTAVGVEVIFDGNRESVQVFIATVAIVLGTGTIADAAILQRSGVGPASLLNSLDIPVVIDSPQVGQNLINQIGPLSIVSIPNTLNPFTVIQTFTALDPTYSAGTRRYQCLSITGFGALFFDSFSPGILGALGISLFTPSTLITGVDLEPNSKGTVTIVSKDPLTDPKIDWNYYSDGDENTFGTDANKTIAFYNQVNAVATAGGGSVLYPTAGQYGGGNSTLFKAAQDSHIITYHAVGSCRMGTNISNGVVDGNLKVFGANNLYIASCSVEPNPNSGNTAYGAFIIGLKLAQILGATIPIA